MTTHPAVAYYLQDLLDPLILLKFKNHYLHRGVRPGLRATRALRRLRLRLLSRMERHRLWCQTVRRSVRRTRPVQERNLSLRVWVEWQALHARR